LHWYVRTGAVVYAFRDKVAISEAKLSRLAVQVLPAAALIHTIHAALEEAVDGAGLAIAVRRSPQNPSKKFALHPSDKC
jgi:hypothetical protein